MNTLSVDRKRNYQKELEKLLEKEKPGKRLLLHSCCAPCSSYVLVYLRQFFRITVFYYNPNITFREEYQKRVEEQKRLIRALNAELDGMCAAGQNDAPGAEAAQGFPIEVIEGDYEPERFLEAARGLEKCPEGGERCEKCFALRLSESAKQAKAGGYDYFTTTLTISPLKNAKKLNEIGEQMAQKYEVAFLPSDFKKKEGYKQSIELSKKYELYRQDYCGCVFSKAERDMRLKTENE